MKKLLKKCRFDRAQNYQVAVGMAIGAAMGAAENDMGFWPGVGASIGLGSPWLTVRAGTADHLFLRGLSYRARSSSFARSRTSRLSSSSESPARFM